MNAAIARTDDETRRVLVCDDEPRLGRLLRLLLEEHGYQVVVTGGVRSARAALSAGPRFDAVLLDVNLEDGDASEVLDEVEGGVAPPAVVLATGLGAEHLPAHLRNRRTVAGCLTKPFAVDELARFLDGVLQRA